MDWRRPLSKLAVALVCCICMISPLEPVVTASEGSQESKMVVIQETEAQIKSLCRQGKFAEACPLAERAVQKVRDALDKDDPLFAVAVKRSIWLEAKTGQYSHAVASC